MDFYEEKDGYLVIPTDSLLVNKVTNFDIYIRVDGKYLFYRMPIPIVNSSLL